MRHLSLMTLAALLIASCAHPPPAAPPAPPSPHPTATPAPSPSPAQGAFFRLYVSTDCPDADFLLASLRAGDAWNAAVGREVFSWQDGRPIRLTQYKAIQTQEAATDTRFTGGITILPLGLVAFSGLTPQASRYHVAAHELGHVIGLSHSDDPADLMFLTTTPASTGAITPNDARRAREALERDAP